MLTVRILEDSMEVKSAENRSEKRGKRQTSVPFLRHTLEFVFVLGVRLDAEGGSKDELTDCGAEAGEESVKGLSRNISLWV